MYKKIRTLELNVKNFHKELGILRKRVAMDSHGCKTLERVTKYELDEVARQFGGKLYNCCNEKQEVYVLEMKLTFKYEEYIPLGLTDFCCKETKNTDMVFLFCSTQVEKTIATSYWFMVQTEEGETVSGVIRKSWMHFPLGSRFKVPPTTKWREDEYEEFAPEIFPVDMDLLSVQLPKTNLEDVQPETIDWENMDEDGLAYLRYCFDKVGRWEHEFRMKSRIKGTVEWSMVHGFEAWHLFHLERDKRLGLPGAEEYYADRKKYYADKREEAERRKRLGSWK
jgi:hypothetical protein